MSAHILIVEDNVANRELVAYLFHSAGYTPDIARDGMEALEKARAHPPDLILADLNMPRLDGYGLLAEIRADAVLREVPILAVTALAMVGDRSRVLESGFDGYVTKPIDPENLVASVEEFLPASKRHARTA